LVSWKVGKLESWEVGVIKFNINMEVNDVLKGIILEWAKGYFVGYRIGMDIELSHALKDLEFKVKAESNVVLGSNLKKDFDSVLSGIMEKDSDYDFSIGYNPFHRDKFIKVIAASKFRIDGKKVSEKLKEFFLEKGDGLLFGAWLAEDMFFNLFTEKFGKLEGFGIEELRHELENLFIDGSYKFATGCNVSFEVSEAFLNEGKIMLLYKFSTYKNE
jgi:hypothetical protein